MSSVMRESTEEVLEEEAVKAGRKSWADYRKGPPPPLALPSEGGE
jgi:hypothetical protein